MDDSSLEHRLSAKERSQFENEGFLIVRNVLGREQLEVLEKAANKVEREWRPRYAERGLQEGQALNHLDFIGQDESFLELIDHPKTFMKVVDILGWHIQLYHSHIIVTPPRPKGYELSGKRLGWHQDSGRLNIDIESNPRPRISLKVGFFLTDTTPTDRGNFHVIPGSHLSNKVEFPEDGADHPDAIPVQAAPGDAVFFDRRLWHAAGRNVSDVTRKVLFYGYSYRWLKPRDNMTVDHYMASADPVRQQLLGASPNGGFGFTSPVDEDVPLKSWLSERLGEEALAP